MPNKSKTAPTAEASMPTETGAAFLVDPMGHAPQALDKDEFEQVRRFVEVLRDDKQEQLQDAIDWLLRRSVDVPVMDDQAVLDHTAWHYANERGIVGVLARVFHGPPPAGIKDIEDLSEDETATLQAMLLVLRTDSWLPEWLTLQVKTIATGTLPDERYPTPLTIAASLVDCIREHEERWQSARDMVRMRPDLLFPVPVEPQATPEPPAEPEVDQLRNGTTPPSRARKAGKKVAHA
jgi:hypothetical protein